LRGGGWLRVWPVVVLAGERLIPQAELQAVVGGLQACLLKRALELRLLALQELQGIGPLRGHMRGHLTAAVDRKTHIDPTEFRRVEPDVELMRAGLRPRCNGDR
jgi:hypothetical protein